MMNKEVEDTKPHVLVIPFPGQGHINPIVEFSKCLASKGLKVTVITTTGVKRVPQFPQNSSISIATISDGSEEFKKPETVKDYFVRFKTEVSKNLAKFIDEQQVADSPARIVVYDSVMPWVLDIAHERGLLGASFFTQSSAVCAIYYYLRQGLLQFPYEDSTVLLPFLPALGTKDMPFFPEFDDSGTIITLLADQFLNLEKVDWIFFNTFDKLETEVLEWMTTKWPIKTVGPTFSLPQKDTKLSHDNHTISTFEQDYEGSCTEWLNSKKKSSVVYVSFGSVASVNKEQMEELAFGLITSNCYFLWVVRASEQGKLPSDFTSLASEKGLIVNWCRQTEVLAHDAVACFVTHCGWNSTLEALSFGVPVIGMAQWVDQKTNSKFIEDVWSVGIRVEAGENGIVSREEIAKCVKEMMSEGEKGKELRTNAEKWKELANEAVGKGGTSANNVEEFVLKLMFG